MDPRISCFLALYGAAKDLPEPLKTGVDEIVSEAAATFLRHALEGLSLGNTRDTHVLALVAHVLSYSSSDKTQRAGIYLGRQEEIPTTTTSDALLMRAEIAGIDTTMPFFLFVVTLSTHGTDYVFKVVRQDADGRISIENVSDIRAITNIALTRFVNAHERVVKQLTTPAKAIEAEGGTAWESAVWDGVSV
jgi:hypothetical protein